MRNVEDLPLVDMDAVMTTRVVTSSYGLLNLVIISRDKISHLKVFVIRTYLPSPLLQSPEMSVT